MTTPDQALDLAGRYFQTGHLQPAEQLCRQILQADLQHSAAWHLLGLIAAGMGRYDQARDYIRQALVCNPDLVEAHNNLGNVLTQLGQLDEAVASFQRALRLNPRYAEAHVNLGNALRQQGKLDEAMASYRQAVHYKPDFAGAHDNLGVAYRAAGKLEEAVANHRQALHLDPNVAETHHNLGATLSELGKREEAVASYWQAIRLKPGLAEAQSGLAIVLWQQGHLAEAEAGLQQALCHLPHHAEMHYQLGFVLWEQGKLTEAVGCFQQAVRLKQDFADPHYMLGRYWLLQGKLEHGWSEVEWRWKLKECPPRHFAQPCWGGGRLEGKTILLHAEQGFGDTLHFIRYAALVKQQGCTVVVECQPDLLRLLTSCSGIDHLLPLGTPLPAFDVQAPLLSLPGLCGTTLATIPANIPYLVADRARVGHWRDRLAAIPGFKVGICWQGNPQNTNDRRRSVPLTQFAPLAAVPGVRLVSLQHGPGSEQLTALAGPWTIVDLLGQAEESAQGWVDSAALVRALDLVITVDTAVVHLAGALGVPVWVALPFVPDWRWLREREDSPWYPTVRLFRQTTLGDWDTVFAHMAAELAKRLL